MPSADELRRVNQTISGRPIGLALRSWCVDAVGSRTMRVAEHDEREEEVERDEVGVELEEDDEPAEDDLGDEADDETGRRADEVASRRSRRIAARKTAIETTETATVTRRLANSTSGWNECCGGEPVLVARGQSGQPRPEPVRRTAPPVTTSSA